jgi:SNF2 family DNA or RNA helicase
VEHEAAALLLDMGLGKTLVTLTALCDLRLLGEATGRILVIAPLRVALHVWPAEIDKWDHTRGLTYSVAVGDERARSGALAADTDVCIINRENVAWLVEQCRGRRWPFETVVVDELSGFKSHRSKRFRALRSVRPWVRRVIGLTGTPAANGLIDLWAQMYLLDRGERLGGSVGGYRSRYFRPAQQSGRVVYRWAPRRGAEDAIHARIGDVAVSMRAKDVLGLPGRVDSVVEVELGDAGLRAYRRMEREQVLALEGRDVTAASAAVVAGKLLQMANGAVYDDEGGTVVLHGAKLDALREVVEGAQGSPVLCYYAYRHDLARLRAAFPGAVRIDEAGAIDRWNRGEAPLMLAHPQSAGHGLNLQYGGHIVAWFGLTWSLELYQQANARLDRQGQAGTVVVHHIVAKGTMDERVMRVLQGKGSVQDALLDALRAEREDPGMSDIRRIEADVQEATGP